MRVREQVAQIIQQQLRQIGIEIVLVHFPARVLFNELIQRRKSKGLAFYSWLFSPTSDCDILYTSDGIPSEANGWIGENYPGYRNPEMDRVYKAVSREIDDAARKRMFGEIARIFARDLPALPLWNAVSPAVAKTGLRNFSIGFACTLCPPIETWNPWQWAWQ